VVMTKVAFFQRSLLVLVIVLAPILIWYLFDIILIIMGAILVAILIQLVAEPFTAWLKLPPTAALALSTIVIVVVFGGAGYAFGTRISGELQDVIQRASSGQNSIVDAIRHSDLGNFALSHIQAQQFSLADIIKGAFSLSAGLIEGIVVIVVAGLYFAIQPDLYRQGLLQLFPPPWHPNAEETIKDIGNSLRLWLLGQLIQMAAVGVLSTLAVWLIGLPSPLALGLIAAVAEFVPYAGPILAAIPAVLVAAAQGIDAVILTALAYAFIHQIEGHMLAPFIQRYMVFIPPAVMLLSIVAIGFLFGTLAIIFASPITVVVFVLVKKLYVRDGLGEVTAIPRESP